MHEREWSLWCRKFVDKTLASFNRAPSAELQRLRSTLLVLNAEKISLSMRVRLGSGPPVAHERCYPLITDQATGRIILSRPSRRPSWVCRVVGAEIAVLLHEFWDMCDQRTLEWTAYAHLMQQCGERPRPLGDLVPIEHDSARISFGYGGGCGGVARHQINRGRPAIEFPASLPAVADPLPTAPGVGGAGVTVQPGPGADAGGAANAIADTPEQASAMLLRRQVAALQAQLAQQAQLLEASQAAVLQKDIEIRGLAAEVEKLSDRAEKLLEQMSLAELKAYAGVLGITAPDGHEGRKQTWIDAIKGREGNANATSREQSSRPSGGTVLRRLHTSKRKR